MEGWVLIESLSYAPNLETQPLLPRNIFTMSKRTQALAAKVDKTRSYTMSEAISVLTEIASTNFDESLEMHFRLGIDPKKGDQLVRGTVSLPNGTGKNVRVAAFVPESKVKEAKDAGADIAGAQDLIDDIKKSQKTNFDVAIATPEMMAKIGPIAKTLGTRGLMPNPKSDTVTTDPAATIAELKKGKVAFKNDDTANLHLAVGKVSFGAEKLQENVEAVMEMIKKSKPSSAKGIFIKALHLTTTMGPSVKVTVTV